jgi:hypothetical protein
MTARDFGAALRFGSIARCGYLCIPEVYVSEGFQGGGAYVDIPAAVLSPGAPPDAPGNLQLSMNECYWKYMAGPVNVASLACARADMCPLGCEGL